MRKRLDDGPIVYYVGFDPTADSLHIGSLMPIMAMAHLQKSGHTPIVIVGGGTTLIGDPSGKTQLRRLMSHEEIEANGQKILSQLQRYLEFEENAGLFLNNADWLVDLNYIDFLREIGRHFKVNEMIKAEAYKQRLEREEGLSFIEFNYQLLQAYDFLILFQRYGCTLQMGGDDQWGNIIAGIDLIRRVEKGKETLGLTFPLITTARGQKMGKTEKGTIWLDPTRTSPYEFYQYWINCDDRDVERFLAYFTLLPIEQIRELAKLHDEQIREAKEILAFEVTKLAHGEQEASKARDTSGALFGKKSKKAEGISTASIPREELVKGVPIVDLFVKVGFSSSKSAARRLIEQGGAYINDQKVASIDVLVTENDLQGNDLLLRYGKKRYLRVVAE